MRRKKPLYGFDKSDNDNWVRWEAVVYSGAVECEPHLRVEETPESRRGEMWTRAGGKMAR